MGVSVSAFPGSCVVTADERIDCVGNVSSSSVMLLLSPVGEVSPSAFSPVVFAVEGFVGGIAMEGDMACSVFTMMFDLVFCVASFFPVNISVSFTFFSFVFFSFFWERLR